MPPRDRSFPIGAAATLEELDLDPHPVLARLREREPVSWLPALGAWLVTRRDLALEAMRDSEAFTVDDPRFSTGQVVGPSMLSRDGAEHVQRCARGRWHAGACHRPKGEMLCRASRETATLAMLQLPHGKTSRVNIRQVAILHQPVFGAANEKMAAGDRC